jgi:hypothetical protein
VLRGVIEKSSEWGEDLWMAALDVEKAFDRVHHTALFSALMQTTIDVRIVAALKKLYGEMKAFVCLGTGDESREFDVQRGVRQGDPLSSLLFNLVLEQVLAEVSIAWQRRGYGTNVGESVRGKRLTHIAFADDMTLMARSWTSLKRMLSSLRQALAARGLSLHPSKCKAQTNISNWHRRGEIAIEEGFSIEILPEGQGLKLLGTVLALEDSTRIELQNRIAAGWRMFWSMKSLLMNLKVTIKKRLKLFDSTVASCVLWSCQSWTPRMDELKRLRSAQRGMMRKIVGQRRAPEEEWVDWIRRITKKATDMAKRWNIRDWIAAHFLAKWSWAGHVARRPCGAWTWQVTTWRDSEWQHLVEEVGFQRPLRPSKRRWMKWEDILRRYCQERSLGEWTTYAYRRDEWSSAGPDFVAWASQKLRSVRLME